MSNLRDGYGDNFDDMRDCRERSVDSDDGHTTVESAVETLDKLNCINTIVSKQKNLKKIRSQAYNSNLLVGASSRFFKDFRRDEAYRKKIVSLIEQKILSSTKYANFR